MTSVDFSRSAGRVLNAPYWQEDYVGNDPAECVRFHEVRKSEKAILTDACASVESGGGGIDHLPPKVRAIWDRAVATF